MKLRAFLKIMTYGCPSMILALGFTALTVWTIDTPLHVMLGLPTIALWLITIWIAYAEGVRLGWDVE